MKKIDEKSWSTMWENPSITTFGWGDFAENYDGAILEFWKSQLNGEFNQVLDLACGNGALTWIANNHGAQGEGLKAGQVVTTGVCGLPSPIAPGDRIMADFGSLGHVEVTLAIRDHN